MRGLSSVDGDFAVNTGHTTTSFEAFLSSMGEAEEVKEYGHGYEQSVEQEEYADTDADFLNEFEDLFSEDGTEEFDVEDTDEDTEGTEDSDTDEDEDDEDSEGTEEEGFDYAMETWDSSVILPNGIEVSAEDLKEYMEFDSKVQEVNTLRQEVAHKEKMLADNTNITMAAINSVKQQLEHTAAYRPLTILEQAQLQSFSQMENYVNNTVDAFAQTHTQSIQQAERIKQETYSKNIDTCFELYPDLDKDILDIKEYLSSKQVNPNAYLESILMDPTVISILQDAVATNKVKSKVFTPAKRVSRKVQGGHKVAPAPVDNTSVPHGVSSYDVGSYKAFASLGIK